MATLADYSGAMGPTKAPISAHPAFPAIVALWFAALLGLGSLVLPVELLERLVALSHIGAVVSAAEPPLGFTARAGIALVGSIAGAVAGLLLARKVANASAPEPRGRSLQIGADRQCRPISAHDELGDDGLDTSAAAPAAPQQKRRSLAMAEDDRPSAYLQTVPLPGQPADDWDDAPASDETPPAADDEPLELSAFSTAGDDSEEEFFEAAPDERLEALRRRVHTSDTSAFQDISMSDQIFHHSAAIDEDDGEALEFKPRNQSSWRTFEGEPADADPLPFAAPSLMRSLASGFDELVDAEPAFAPPAEIAAAADSFAVDAPPQLKIVEADGEPGDGGDRPLEELGLVQLAARLGASIEKRRAWVAERQSQAAPPSPAAPFCEAEDFEVAQPEEAARAIADFFGPADAAQDHPQVPAADVGLADADETRDGPTVSSWAPVPAALREIQPEADEDFGPDYLDPSLSLPLGSAPVESFESADGEETDYDEVESDEGDYSSLLAMKNPFARQQDFVRVEEPADESDSVEPAVAFPSPPPISAAYSEAGETPSAARPFDPPKNQAATVPSPTAAAPSPDRGETERSLRDALATLQRMSGAA